MFGRVLISKVRVYIVINSDFVPVSDPRCGLHSLKSAYEATSEIKPPNYWYIVFDLHT